MQDLTQGSISKHIIRIAAPMAAGMIFQMLYVMIDMYFVAKQGDAALAGVGAAGNVQFIVMSLTQILGVGTMVLISHAAGRRDREDANLIFNQSLLLAALCATITLVFGYGLSGTYMGIVGADPATMAAGKTYLTWYLPGMASQFALVAMGSALRGTGIAKPTMIVQILTVVLNALLAPVLIVGWLTGRPFGVAGAGLASTISIVAGVMMMLVYFIKLETFVAFDPKMFRARLEAWKRILRIGLPAGGEFGLLFLNMVVIYWIIRDFGSAAQAGFVVGSRVMQAVFLPAMCIAFAAAPVAGQNVGAGKHDRARETFRSAALIGSVCMGILTIFCQFRSDALVRVFTSDPAVIGVGADYLQMISFNFIASGMIFTCSGMFQALGNTVPSVISSLTRLVTFAFPAVWLASRSGFALHQLWVLSVSTSWIQVGVSVWLLQREFGKKARATPPVIAVTA